MKRILIIAIFTLYSMCFSNICKSQSSGCIDSITFNQYSPSEFTVPVPVGAAFNYAPQRDSFDNVYLSGYTDVGPSSYWSIIKFNASNQLIFYKNYRTLPGGQFLGGGNLHDIEPNGNLLFSEGNSFPYSQIISKTDNTGNLLWSKKITHANTAMLGGLRLPITDNNGELYCAGSFADDPNKPVLIALDVSGNIKWIKKYQHITVPKFHLLEIELTSQDNITIALAVQYYYNADVVTDPAAKFGLQLVKINKADGTILQQKSISYFNDAASTIPNRAQLKKIKYSKSTNQFVLDFDQSGFGISKRMFTLLDDNFNLLKTIYLSSAPKIISSITKINISPDNVITMMNAIQSSTNRLLYTAIDNNLNVITQKGINLNILGFPNRNYQADLAYKKNGILNIQLATYTNFLSDYLFLLDHSPFYNTLSPCLGKDSVIYNPVPIYVYPLVNPTIEEAGTVPLLVTDLIPDFPPVDFPLPKTDICKVVSQCDTIKLFGSSYHCLSSPLDSFKIFRNPLCKRVTNWQIDTNYIKILNQNDTALYVEYKKPYRGTIKVSFGGCSLTDSIAVEVYAAQTGVNLGNDTMHCPGKAITLRAGKYFRTYLWQNGSSKDSLIASQPGQYDVTVTDSCGNVFKDTLQINPFDVELKTDYPQQLCPSDTITFNLPNNLYNYSWLPSTNSSLNNITWKLFPSITTTYSISGERLPGCIVSDTVLINVKSNCLPDYIYFPNAFTPDNNGINDTYKPGFNGQLVLYRFAVYNRYGQLVFTTTDPTKGWDGAFKNSSKPSTGSYVWSCNYQFLGRPSQQEQGVFTLIR